MPDFWLALQGVSKTTEFEIALNFAKQLLVSSFLCI
jgi:hypothetical protein